MLCGSSIGSFQRNQRKDQNDDRSSRTLNSFTSCFPEVRICFDAKQMLVQSQDLEGSLNIACLYSVDII